MGVYYVYKSTFLPFTADTAANMRRTLPAAALSDILTSRNRGPTTNLLGLPCFSITHRRFCSSFFPALLALSLGEAKLTDWSSFDLLPSLTQRSKLHSHAAIVLLAGWSTKGCVREPTSGWLLFHSLSPHP
ncbi:hypothetical protein R3P38DRAFT_1816118 [Favolaschia claudopus]|uniref:Uncharacterized protein n=1 Tax=Favolaschia claudopus TaxID=2862362 RepID=A0AAW0A4L2_9AGAR